MSSPSAASPLNVPRALAATALPWLFSTTAHACLFLFLALAYYWTRERAQPNIGSPSGLNVIFVSSAGNDDGVAGDLVNVSPDSPGGEYYDDEPSAVATTSEQAREAGGGALAALLNEKPTVSLDGVLPASGSFAGASTGRDAAGLASAESMTRGPRGSSRLRGGYARTGVFGAIGEGRKFVYVFDRSGSMDLHGGAPLAAAKAELAGSLKDLGQTHQFQIIFYNEHPRLFNPTGTPGRLVFGTQQNKYLAQKFVGSITADGATRHDEALEMALRMGPDVIFFLTDADEPRMTARQLARVAQLNEGAAIHAIEFGYGAQSDPDDFLVKLARQNGGQHVYVDISRLPAARR